MGSIKKSLKTTWWLFEANNESPFTVAMSRIMLVFVPIIVGLGIGFSLALSSGSILLGIFAGIAIFILIAGAMTSNTPEVERQVDRYLADEDYLDADREYVKTYESAQSPLKPAFYQGVGEWMCNRHVPIKQFIEAIQSVDPTARSMPFDRLVDAVQYNYATTTYSHRLKREALKIVAKDTPNSFPITRLKATYDFYLEDTAPEVHS